MRVACVLVLFAIGCKTSPLAPYDLASSADLAPTPDAASSTMDLATVCPASAQPSTTTLRGMALPDAWLGQITSTSESGCGGPPNYVRVALEPSSVFSDDPPASLSIALPLALGTSMTTAADFTSGAEVLGLGTVDVKAFTLIGMGPGVMTLEADVDVASLKLTGHVSAVACPLLDSECI